MHVLTRPRAGVPFVDRLADFGDRSAVVAGPSGLTYGELATRVEGARARLGEVRRLVLIEAVNTVDCLVAYLGALAGGHPVLLTPGTSSGEAADSATRGSQRSYDLIDRYDPDVVVRPLGAGARLEERRPGTRHDLHPDLALLLSTSGSAGSPKLVRLSAENLQANAESVAASLDLRSTDRAITSLPLAYCYGLSVVHSHLLRGASLVLTDLSVVDACFWDLVREHSVTSLAGVPYTFDLLDRVGFASMDLPSLRYVTQAGGRLAPERVVRYAELGRTRGWDLVVMYGQTEATARMAFLPPSSALTRPCAVGVPVPGGRFRIDPVDDGAAGAGGAVGAVGEVVYEGDNVMLGYAETSADLALGRTTTELRTGDLGRIAPDGLLEITGRRSAFLKILGTRIDLDRVDAMLASMGMASCSTGDDGALAVAVEGCEYPRLVRGLLASELHLPASVVHVRAVEAIPRLASGKPDRTATRALLAALTDDEARWRTPGSGGADGPTTAPRPGASPLDALVALFADVLDRPDATPDSTFVGLGGDSLSFVSLSVRLEEELGVLPEGWHLLPIRDLAARRRARRPAWAAVETGVALRAAAIVAVVGTHAGLFTLRGGAHLLLGLAGYNFARFTLAAGPRGRAGRIARSVARIAVPSIVWIAAVALITGDYLPSTALLLNGALGPDRWGPDWHFWYVEALVWILLGAAALMAVPAADRWQRRAPFGFALALLAVGLLPRFDVVEVWTGPERGTPQYIFWIFALGWAAAAARRSWHRLLVSALLLVTVPGFFDQPARDAVVAGGLIGLLWLPTVRMPRQVARVTALLAGASLYIYLTQWQVYPLLDGVPALALLASLAVGVGAWTCVTWVQRSPAPSAARALRRLRGRPVDSGLPRPADGK
jgi:acyl-CoA synthetase (AMP-forming)/AMP-acid ligase II